MGEDILKRLGDILKDDHNAFTRATAIAAQAEIMRLEERSKGLRRERDALRAELAVEQNRYKDLLQSWAEMKELRDAARAELAAANEEKRQTLVGANELLLDVKNAEAKVDGYRGALKVVEAECDALRDALREARDNGLETPMFKAEFVARIDALLNGGGDE